MKCLVEFFDVENINNVIAPIAFSPEHIIYICDKSCDEKDNKIVVKSFIKKRLPNVKIDFISADCTYPKGLLALFETLHNTYPDKITIELTGGHELTHLMAGMFCAGKGLPCFHIDIKNTHFVNIKGCSSLSDTFAMPKLSAADIIELQGALLERHCHYVPDINDTDLMDDIKNIFFVIKDNFYGWGAFANYLAKLICISRESNESLTILAEKELMIKVTNNKIYSMLRDDYILKKLENKGVLSILLNKKTPRITFKNEIIMKLFKDAGAWLEYYAFIQAVKSKYFDDVQISCQIDWDGEIVDFSKAECEIDLLLTKDGIPLFVSCKIGEVTKDTLHEIKLMSIKFGGKYAKAAVITGCTSDTGGFKAMHKKAKELHVAIIDGDDINDEKIAEQLIKVADETYDYKILS